MSDDAEDDMINHPPHYRNADPAYEAIKVIRAWGLGFSLGNAVKYIARAGRKNAANEIEDLEKSCWYLQEHIAWLKDQTVVPSPARRAVRFPVVDREFLT